MANQTNKSMPLGKRWERLQGVPRDEFVEKDDWTLEKYYKEGGEYFSGLETLTSLWPGKDLMPSVHDDDDDIDLNRYEGRKNRGFMCLVLDEWKAWEEEKGREVHPVRGQDGSRWPYGECPNWLKRSVSVDIYDKRMEAIYNFFKKEMSTRRAFENLSKRQLFDKIYYKNQTDYKRNIWEKKGKGAKTCKKLKEAKNEVGFAKCKKERQKELIQINKASRAKRHAANKKLASRQKIFGTTLTDVNKDGGRRGRKKKRKSRRKKKTKKRRKTKRKSRHRKSRRRRSRKFRR